MGFEIDGLDELTDNLKLIQSNYPKEVKKFMQNEGTKLKNRTLKKAKKSVKKKTGNFFEGIKRGKYYKYNATGADSIRVYAGRPAFHAHLLEKGHRMVSHSREVIGEYVKGHHIFEVSANEFEATYNDDCDKFADKIATELNKG